MLFRSEVDTVKMVALECPVIAEPGNEVPVGAGGEWLLSGSELSFQEASIDQDSVSAHV